MRRNARRNAIIQLYLKGTTMADFTGTKRQLESPFSTNTAKADRAEEDSALATALRRSTASVLPSQAPAASKDPSQEDKAERIRRRAYEIYEQRGRQDGQEVEDWLRAEQEVSGESLA